MRNKTPGKLNAPPSQDVFNRLPLAKFSGPFRGVFYRLHSLNRSTGTHWPAIYFSKRGKTRFDPINGLGSLYFGSSLAGAMMEMFDDRWGAAGSSSRRLTQAQLREWWVTLISTPVVNLFEAEGSNLSKIGTDSQLTTGDHTLARGWALRMMRHPDTVGGITFNSRHDPSQRNVALFNRNGLTPELFDTELIPPSSTHARGPAGFNGPLKIGPAILLHDHSELDHALRSLEVAVTP
jgi:hypothetical protein